MKIVAFADWRFARCPIPTGVSKHLLHVLQELSVRLGPDLCRLTTADQFHPLNPPYPPLRTTRLPIPWHCAELLWTLTGRPYADDPCRETDWVYCPKNDFIPVRRARLAFTVHGLHEFDPTLNSRGRCRHWAERMRRRAAYARAFRRANCILTVSHFLKDQLVRIFSLSPERIHVIGNGVEPVYSTPERNLVIPPSVQPYLLAVGGLNLLDGGDRLLDVARLMHCDLPTFQLQIAGSTHEPSLAARAATLPNVQLLGYLPAQQLAVLMRSAFALLFPTRYESFGIAVAEAMASGLPVIASRSTAVPEILGDAGCYAERPDDPGEWVDLIKSLLHLPGLRSQCVQRGRARSREYTWARTADRLLRALDFSG